MIHPGAYLAIPDKDLLAQCQVHVHRASGPGGQHRNKVSSAVRVHHQPTGLTASAADSRSQRDNRRLALARLRMKLACRLRTPLDTRQMQLPEVVRRCLLTPKGADRTGRRRLQVGRKDHQFWPVAAFCLDLLDALDGRLGEAAKLLGVSSSNLVSLFQSDRHLLGAAQEIRKRHGLKPLA